MKKIEFLSSIAMAIMAMMFGFGNAIRCLFFIHYESAFDRGFYAVMLSIIGCVGIWWWNTARDEYRNGKNKEA